MSTKTTFKRIALVAVAALGLGVLAAGASLGHRLFAYQGFKVWIIEVSADIIGLVLMGLVIGLF